MLRHFFHAIVACIVISGCGGGGGGSIVTLSVAPPAAGLPVGGTTTFTPALAGSVDTAVQWSVQEGAAGGSITPAGVYTAPGLAGTYHVIATSHADPTKTFTVPVIVHVAVAINPPFVTTTLNKPTQFSAVVSGTANTAVTWSVVEAGGGIISAAGAYVAPNVRGTYHATATSQADVNQSATATVVVQGGSADGTIQ